MLAWRACLVNAWCFERVGHEQSKCGGGTCAHFAAVRQQLCNSNRNGADEQERQRLLRKGSGSSGGGFVREPEMVPHDSAEGFL